MSSADTCVNGAILTLVSVGLRTRTFCLQRLVRPNRINWMRGRWKHGSYLENRTQTAGKPSLGESESLNYQEKLKKAD